MTPQAAYDELLRRAREESLLESCPRRLSRLGRVNSRTCRRGAWRPAPISWRIWPACTMPGRRSRASASCWPASKVRRCWPIRFRAAGCQRAAKSGGLITVSSACRARWSKNWPHVAPYSIEQQQWATSRQEADFASFCPWLEKIVALERQEAECLGYEKTPYDALLEYHEPGARTADIARLFKALRSELSPLLAAIAGSRRRRKHAILKRNYPVERQHAFCVEAAIALGFDFQRGRVDTSVHPFSTHIAPGDCRIAIRYDANYFADGFFALLHEVGHGLYEQGLDPEHEGTPLGAVNSLALHESQSRLWENMVGRGLPFWKYFFPR